MRRESTKQRTQVKPDECVGGGAGGPDAAVRMLVEQALQQKGSATMNPTLRELMTLLNMWRSLPEDMPREVELEWREEEE